MEIELDLNSGVGWFSGVIALLFLMVIWGWVGYHVTPENGGVLTWSEWQVFLARRDFQREARLLQEEAEQLAALLQTQRRDPVQAQLLVSRLQQRLREVQSPALATPKNRLLEAAQAVLDWSQGVGDYGTAVQALHTFTSAMDALNEP